MRSGRSSRVSPQKNSDRGNLKHRLPVVSRRRVVFSAFGLGLGGSSLVGPGLAISSCNQAKPFSCIDVSALNPNQIRVRETLEYRDKAAKPELACDLCVQYIFPASREGCGGCKVMPGPTHPKGSCKVFAKKV